MKPFEILSSLPQTARLGAAAIVDSPAFAMPCRLGEENVTLVLGAVRPADTIDLSVMLGDEPHILSIARSPRFGNLDAVWNNRGEVPEPVLLAIVEKDAGPLFALVENAVRRQFRLLGLAAAVDAGAEKISAQVADVVFALTRSQIVTASLGVLRNIDASHESIRSVKLQAVVEYAAFSLPQSDAAALAVGDAVLLPEIGTVSPRIVVDGRFALDGDGVSRYDPGDLVHVVDASAKDVSLGELFDAAETPRPVEVKPSGALCLAAKGRTLAVGRMDRIGDQPAFIVESTQNL